MSDEQDKLKLSLEPPKLFGRKKKSTGRTDASEPADVARPAAEKTDPDESTTVIDEVEPAPAEDPAEEELTAVIEDVKAAEASPAETTDDDGGAAAVAEPEAEPEPEPVVEPEPVPVTEEPVEDTAVLEPVEEPAAKPAPKPRLKKAAAVRRPAVEEPQVEPAGASSVDVEPEPMSDLDLEDAEIAAMAARGPLLAIYPAAALTGLAVGAAMVVLTWLSLRGCEAVRGTASCGGGPGFLLLVATFVICVLLGSALLKALDVPDPGSSSFLAVGLVAVVALLFLIDFLESWTMLIVIPIISIGGYLASVWVTKTFVEPADT